MNQSLPHVDLSESFGKPSRAAGIKLPTAKKVAPKPEPVEQKTDTRKPVVKPAEASEPTVEATPVAAEPAAPKDRREPPRGDEEGGTAPRPSELGNTIKSSSVHIPAPLLEQTVLYRDANGMSNGQVVIAAIEYAHSNLKSLIHPGATGGGLFVQRATKGNRTNEGPLTPLNVRLFEADYEVIDSLVQKFGAFSRGHLITVSLREFFSSH